MKSIGVFSCDIAAKRAAPGYHGGDRRPGNTISTAAITRKRSVQQAEREQEQCSTFESVPVVAVQKATQLDSESPPNQTIVVLVDSNVRNRPGRSQSL